MEKKELLDQVVNNSLDFLNRSIDEFPDHPKYSLINFHSAVELFLKARLLAEHWSLVVATRQEADWEKFISGDFRSVSLDEAANRLEKVARSGLTDQEHRTFKKLAKDRNQMVHFFHPLEKDERFISGVVMTQLTAWYFLYRLLRKRWKDVFNAWSEEIESIDARLRKYHEFLQVVFDNIADELRDRSGKGAILRPCPSCQFPSQEHSRVLNSIYESKCLVCGLVETNFRLECPSCEATVYFANEGFAQCDGCGQRLEPEDLVAMLHDSRQTAMARGDGDYSWGLSNCGFCDGLHTVVRIDEDEYLCGCCFETFNTVAPCGWCNEGNTGDMEDSYLSGCNQCDGWFGWNADD